MIAPHLVLRPAVIRAQIDVFKTLGVGRDSEGQTNEPAVVGHGMRAAPAGDLDLQRSVLERHAVEDREATVAARFVSFEQPDRCASLVLSVLRDHAFEREFVERQSDGFLRRDAPGECCCRCGRNDECQEAKHGGNFALASGKVKDNVHRMRLFRDFAVTVVVAGWLATGTPTAQPAGPFDIVLTGGRVMDPATGLDAVRHIGLRGSQIAAISTTPLAAATTIDVAGLVVSPGFIDPHAHAQTLEGNRFQARDGVTTALELESGALPIDDWYRSRAGQALLNYGATVGHIYSRIAVMHNQERWSEISATRQDATTPNPEWAFRKPAAGEIDTMIAHLERGLAAGALGIGMGPAYTPAASREELVRVFELAARRKALAFIHMRSAGEVEPGGSIDALQEVLANVAATGASVHIVHVTSMGLRQTRRLLSMIDGARARGLDVTTELYPYTAASTYLQSALFEPGWQERFAIGFNDVQWAATGERLTADTFAKYRARGGFVVIHMIPEDALRAALTHPQVMIGSDGVPLTNGGGHPRGVGTYARVLGRYVRDEKLLDLMTALAKMTIMPARRLEPFVPAMRRKGRLAVGADADVTVFDPARVIDRATYERPAQFSEGIKHVIVGGTFVVRDEQLVPNVTPGRPIRATTP